MESIGDKGERRRVDRNPRVGRLAFNNAHETLVKQIIACNDSLSSAMVRIYTPRDTQYHYPLLPSGGRRQSPTARHTHRHVFVAGSSNTQSNVGDAPSYHAALPVPSSDMVSCSFL